jgi:MFS family permease
VGLALFGASLTLLPMAIVGIAIAGSGFGALLGAPTRYIVSNEAPAEMRGTAVGLLSVFLIVGQIFGGSLAGGIVGADIGDVAGYRNAYFAFALIAFATVFGTFALAPRARERRSAINTSS